MCYAIGVSVPSLHRHLMSPGIKTCTEYRMSVELIYYKQSFVNYRHCVRYKGYF